MGEGVIGKKGKVLGRDPLFWVRDTRKQAPETSERPVEDERPTEHLATAPAAKPEAVSSKAPAASAPGAQPAALKPPPASGQPRPAPAPATADTALAPARPPGYGAYT